MKKPSRTDKEMEKGRGARLRLLGPPSTPL